MEDHMKIDLAGTAASVVVAAIHAKAVEKQDVPAMLADVYAALVKAFTETKDA